MKFLLHKPLISYFSVLSAELLLALFAQYFSPHAFSLISLLNSLSIVCLLFLSAGLIIFIIQGGFFDGIIYSFKRFSRTVRKNRLGDADAEAPLAEYRKRSGRRSPFTWPLIWVSLSLFCLSLAVSVLI
ncbi:DUF3899 domain-containing protein [Sporolactobacillus sp. CQH2019]|uniref:DUF3899 domain-containing protein n=1 Tax=Sporolactobacillus sp. CQH2019 TaxID=3023512 RepID=UPI00236752ED|nr:DUF3899 domain-containing protein [Sporolactobacillus sp. CQH2019]MDD9147284.1 DUF3899 domain-containing protein [Sporolactobacillus sp. CQH2019]